MVPQRHMDKHRIPRLAGTHRRCCVSCTQTTNLCDAAGRAGVGGVGGVYGESGKTQPGERIKKSSTPIGKCVLDNRVSSGFITLVKQ